MGKSSSHHTNQRLAVLARPVPRIFQGIRSGEINSRSTRLLCPQEQTPRQGCGRSAKDPDDLLFRVSARLHVHSLPGDGLYPFLEEFAGLRLHFRQRPSFRPIRNHPMQGGDHCVGRCPDDPPGQISTSSGQRHRSLAILVAHGTRSPGTASESAG